VLVETALRYLSAESLKRVAEEHNVPVPSQKEEIIQKLVSEGITLQDLPIEYLQNIAIRLILSADKESIINFIEKAILLTSKDRPKLTLSQCLAAEANKRYNQYLLENNLVTSKEEMDEQWKGYKESFIKIDMNKSSSAKLFRLKLYSVMNISTHDMADLAPLYVVRG
jgi:hypothetical protein